MSSARATKIRGSNKLCINRRNRCYTWCPYANWRMDSSYAKRVMARDLFVRFLMLISYFGDLNLRILDVMSHANIFFCAYSHAIQINYAFVMAKFD